jgi:hypothetical protein
MGQRICLKISITGDCTQGRGWRVDDRRIDNGPGLQQQPLALKQAANQAKDLFGQLMLFEQVAKAQDRRLRVVQTTEPTCAELP